MLLRPSVDGVLEDAATKIDVSNTKLLDTIQSEIDETIEALDRAQHAHVNESTARDDLNQSVQELQRVTAQLWSRP